MRIVIDKTDELKLKQLVIAIDAEEFCNGSGRVTINASILSSDGLAFVLQNRTLDVPKIEFPPKQVSP